MARFEVVDEQPEPTVTDFSSRASQAVSNTATQLLVLGLKTLSQRALVATADLFTLLTIASAFWLWMATPEPNTLQIVSLSIYAVFVLLANWIVRGRR